MSPDFDVVDLGTKHGNAIDSFFRYAANAGLPAEQLAGFQKSRCVGYEREQAAEYRSIVETKGYQFRLANLTMEANLNDLPTADVYLLWHFLEHLPTKLESQRVLLAALARTRTMVWLKLPSFQPDAYNGEGVLRDRGLRFTWTEWTGHPTPWLLQDCQKTLELWQTQAADRSYSTLVRPARVIEYSDNRHVVPINAPVDTLKYDPRHGPKPDPPIRFPRRVVAEWDVIIHFQP